MGFVDGFMRRFGRLLIGSFFDQVAVIGADRFPGEGPVLVVANHPNSLIDGVLLASHLPRYSKLVAASTVWDNRALVPLLSAAGVIPVFRRHEVGAVAGRNDGAFHAATALFAAQGVLTMFPEGKSHDNDDLQPLKKGAARMALSALEAPGAQALKIVPVAIVYEDKSQFRSGAALCIGSPVDPSAYAVQEVGDVARLTQDIRAGLDDALSEADARIAAALWAEGRKRADLCRSPVFRALRRGLAGLSIALAALPNGVPWLLSRRVASGKDRDKRATWSLFASILLFPVAWLVFALLGAVVAAALGGMEAGELRRIAALCLLSGPLTAMLAARMWRWRPGAVQATG